MGHRQPASALPTPTHRPPLPVECAMEVSVRGEGRGSGSLGTSGCLVTHSREGGGRQPKVGPSVESRLQVSNMCLDIFTTLLAEHFKQQEQQQKSAQHEP